MSPCFLVTQSDVISPFVFLLFSNKSRILAAINNYVCVPSVASVWSRDRA